MRMSTVLFLIQWKQMRLSFPWLRLKCTTDLMKITFSSSSDVALIAALLAHIWRKKSCRSYLYVNPRRRINESININQLHFRDSISYCWVTFFFVPSQTCPCLKILFNIYWAKTINHPAWPKTVPINCSTHFDYVNQSGLSWSVCTTLSTG